jgi:hypothetical protein
MCGNGRLVFCYRAQQRLYLFDSQVLETVSRAKCIIVILGKVANGLSSQNLGTDIEKYVSTASRISCAAFGPGKENCVVGYIGQDGTQNICTSLEDWSPSRRSHP